MNLSDKIFIQEAIELLRIQNKPLDYVMHSLMNEQKLSTYFDLNVSATTFAGIDMQQINEDGDELPYVNGPPPTEIKGPREKILEADVVGKDEISVRIFEHEGKQYCGADSEGAHPKAIVLGFDAIYFNKSEVQTHQELPPYLDKEHEHYAPELDLAIQLHQAIFVEKYGNQGHQREDRVIKWLGENYKNHGFRDAKIKRLSSIIGVKKLKEKK
jgi:hypothetical protein